MSPFYINKTKQKFIQNFKRIKKKGGSKLAIETSLKVRLLNASKTHAEWTAVDPVLKKGEIAYSSDKKQIRVGDGSSKWSQLSYIDAGHITGLSNSGSTITYTKADGSTGTITLPDYDVATSTTPGLVKSGGDITVASDGAVTVNKSTTLKTDKATAAGDRPVWTSWIGDNTKAAYDTDFTYDSTTNTLKVKKIDGVELTGTPTAPTATAGTKTKQIATTEFVQNAVGNGVDDIEIGGRNLVKDSYSPVPYGVVSSQYYYKSWHLYELPYAINDKFIASADIDVIAGNVTSVTFYLYNTTDGGCSNTCTGEIVNGRASTTITVTKAATKDLMLLIYCGLAGATKDNNITVSKVKLERGNKPTDWTPAPEDLVSDITLSGSTLSYKNPIGTQLGSYTLTKSTVGLGNVDNTSDANKPISTATQTALDQLSAKIGNAKLFTGTCSSAADATAKAVTCPAFTTSDLVKGTQISVYFDNTNTGAVGSLTLNVNSTGAKSIRYIYNGSYTTIPSAGYIKTGQMYNFVYDGTYWVIDMMYNTNTLPNIIYYYNNTYAKKAIAANRWIVGDKDGYEEIASGVIFDLSYPILYTNGAVSQGSSNYANMFMQLYDLNLGNIKSGFTSSAKKMIYLVVTISGNTATIDSSIITDTLPTSDDGKAYITLGRLGAQSTGANYFLFQAVHPIFVYKKGALRLYSGSADVVNGHTVEADVPSGAKFTDSNVLQRLYTANYDLPLLMSYSANNYTTQDYTGLVFRNNSIYANPSTGIITAPILKSNKYLQIKNQGINVVSTYTGANVDEIILYTGIKFVSANLMPKIHITGYAYGASSPIDLDVVFYIYNNKLCSQGVVDNGGWHPNVYLFKYTKNSTEYVAVALRPSSSIYYPSVSADIINEALGQLTNIDLSLFNFQFTAKDADSVIPETDGGTTCIEVPYKTNYNPKPTLTFQMAGTNSAVYNGTETVTFNVTKAGIGLGNVENKSSATIRGELTAGNVTTALGYTPLNKAGDSMSGALALLGNQYGDSYSSYALNLNNSNIVGVNSIYTADLSDNSQEGIHFYRSTTAVDTLYAKNGVLYFVPNRTLGQNGTSYTILNSNNYTSYTQKVNDGNTSYLFNKGAYVGGSGAKKYLRITLPDNQANVWNMFYMEVSLRQHSPSESGGKILIEAMHNATSPYTWTGFNASVLGYLPSTLTVHVSDAKYFYILNNTTYASASLDRILVGDTVRSYDISAVTLDWVDELPETHQDATMYYGIHTGNISAHLNDIYVNRSGDTMTGDLTLHSDSGNSPAIMFKRGTDTDTLTDWKVYVTGGNLIFQSRDSTISPTNTWMTKLTVAQSGVITATTFSGSLTGNATSATALKTSGTILTDLGSTTAATYTSGGNITPGVTGTLAVGNGGTGQTTAVNAANALLDSLSAGSSNPVDGDTYIASYADGKNVTHNGTNTYHRRPVSALWNYIKGKADTVYSPKAGSTSLNQLAATVKLGTGDAATIDQSNGTYRQRIQILDNSTANDAVFTFQQSSNSGSSYTTLMEIDDNGNVKATKFTGNLTGNVTGTADEAKALITLGDKRSVATTPDDYKNKIVFAGLKSKATINNPSSDTYSYVIGLRGWADNSGGKAYEFALNNSGINYRLEDTNTTWNGWNTIAHAPNGGVGDAGTPIYMDTDGTLKSISVKNLTSATNLGWVSQANDKTILLNSNVLAYWNGRYSDGASNLAYCNKGAFGTIVTKNTGDYIPISGSTSVTGTIRTTGNLQTRGTAETQIGVGYKTEDTERWFYLWGNNSNGTRGIWDDKKGCVIQTTDTSSHFYGTSDSTSALLSASSGVSASTIDTFVTAKQMTWASASGISGVGLDGNDGIIVAIPYSNTTVYARQFLLDDDSSKMFTRCRISNNWQSWDQILTKSVADGIYASGDFVSKSGDTITGPLVISGSSASLQVEGYGLYVNASDNTIIGDLLFNGSMDLHGDIVQTPTYHITGSFGYAMLTIQNKAISATSNSAITGFTSSHYNDTLFSHSGDTITIKKHGIYRMVIRWHLSSTSSAASVKNVAWAKSGTTTELGWGAVGRANTYETITSEFLQEISASTTLTLIGRSEGGSSTFRGINAWVELVELL